MESVKKRRKIREVEYVPLSEENLIENILEAQKTIDLSSFQQYVDKEIKELDVKGLDLDAPLVDLNRMTLNFKEYEDLVRFNKEKLEIFEDDVNLIKKLLISKIMGQKNLIKIQDPIPFIKPVLGFYDIKQNVNQMSNSLIEKFKEIYGFLEHGVVNGDSSSCILIGNKSSGKSLVLETAIEKLHESYNTKGNKTFITIRLSGSVQTDDRMAVREIARQLDLNLKDFGNENNNRFKKFYDTKEDEKLSDSEEENDNDFEENDKKFEKSSINETFAAILTSLEEIRIGGASNYNQNRKNPNSLALVFLIDEFERFTVHNRQTLLYNLFDLASSNHTIPISVIGLTTKVTIKDFLEKRVSSRFSQRVITFFGSFGINNFNSKGFMVNFHTDSEAEYFWIDHRFNLCINFKEIQGFKNKKYPLVWNDYINSLFYESSFGKNFKQLFLKNFVTVKDHRQLSLSMIYPLTKLTRNNPFLSDEKLTLYNKINNFQGFNQNPKDSPLYNLLKNGISDHQLLLLICAIRVILKIDINYINFNLCYDEYIKLSKEIGISRNLTKNLIENQSFGIKIYNKESCRNNWEKLEELNLIISPNSINSSIISKFQNKGSMQITENYDTRFFQLQVGLLDLREALGSDHTYFRFIRS